MEENDVLGDGEGLGEDLCDRDRGELFDWARSTFSGTFEEGRQVRRLVRRLGKLAGNYEVYEPETYKTLMGKVMVQLEEMELDLTEIDLSKLPDVVVNVIEDLKNSLEDEDGRNGEEES